MDQTVVLCTLVAFLLYYNTLGADFAYDDSRAIKTNPDVQPSSPWINVLFNDFWGTPLTHSGSHKSYRPLCVLSFRFNFWTHELHPLGYHLINVLLHCVATALFTCLTRSLFHPRVSGLPTAVAGFLFAAHPIHTEAVAGIVGRADVGAAIFFLLAFFSYRRYTWARSTLHLCGQHGPPPATGNGSLHSSKLSKMCSQTSIYANNNGSAAVAGLLAASSSSSPCRSFLATATNSIVKWPLTGLPKSSGVPLTAKSGQVASLLALRTRKWLWLASTVICAACSMLTKEHGVTVLAVCAVYDLLVHSRIKPKELLSSLFQRKHRGLGEGLLTLSASAVVLIAVRFHLMGSKAPEFAPADNPAADSSSWLTRTLTFLHLPLINFWLLVQPSVLSFDWSMEAIPLISSASDGRNVITCLFYLALGYSAWVLLRAQARRKEVDASATSARDLISAASLSQCDTLRNGHGFHPHPSASMGSSSSVLAALSLSSNNNSSSHLQHQVHCLQQLEPARVPSYDSLDLTVIALSMLVLPFIPATNLFFYVGFVVAERVLYIPSIGYCLAVAIGCHVIHDLKLRTRRLKLIFRVALVVLFLLYAARTVSRNQDWLTEESLYRSGININPPKAYGNLANILSSTGRKDEAEWAYKKALSYRNNMADVHYNLGILYQEQKRYEEAIQSYKSAIHYRPRMAMAHLNMGLVLALLGHKDEAVDVYRRCSQLDGSGLKDPRTHETTKISALFNLGRLYADDGQYQRAIDVYSEAIQRMPPHYQAQSLHNMLGEAYFKLDRLKEAEFWYREALRVKADHIPAHLTYGKLLTRMNRLAEAEELFLRAKTLAPNDSTVYQHYGQYLSECERHTEAAEQYVKAAQLAPTEYEIIFNAANTLRQAGRHAEAERYYRTAVRLRPTEATSHMNLGAMLHVNGKLIEAEQSYLEALRLKPDDHITRTNLQKLRHLLHKKGISSSRR